VLPTASTKYLNPLNRNQKLGYHQARILNIWNSLVNEQEQYLNLLHTTPSDYANKRRAAIREDVFL